MKSFKRKKTFQNLEPSAPLPPKILEPTALNLIELRRDKLVLNEEAIQTLKEIKEDLIIVFIFGKKGTGKSFLMNLLINVNEKKKQSIRSSMISSKYLRGFKVNTYFNSLKGRGFMKYVNQLDYPYIKYETGTMLQGGQTVERLFSMDEYPVYVKAGSIIPYYGKVKNLSGTEQPVIVRVFPGGDKGDFTL